MRYKRFVRFRNELLNCIFTKAADYGNNGVLGDVGFDRFCGLFLLFQNICSDGHFW